jgi:hypothetical protein
MENSHERYSSARILLIIIIVAIIGAVGAYVWHSQKTVDDTYNATGNQSVAPSKQKTINSNSTQATPAPSASQNFTIKEWGVTAPYSDNLILEYKLNSKGSLPRSAIFSSKQLDASSAQCSHNHSYGGRIDQYRYNEEMSGAGNSTGNSTAEEYAKTLKKSEYAHIGDYYYFFRHSQGACGDSSKSNEIQAQTNNAVKDLVSKLQAVQ